MWQKFLNFINPQHTNCRCCKTPIANSGYGIAMLGAGFCGACFVKILKKG